MVTLLAFDVPAPIKSKLKATCAALQPLAENTEWLSIEQMHVQMAYVGDMPPSFMEHLGNATRKALEGVAPIPCQAKGLGFYGSRRYMSSIWCTVEPGDVLDALYDSLWDQLRRLGYRPVHGVDFHARINLAFCKGRTRNEKLVDELEAFGATDFGSWTPTSLNLLEQSKGPKGYRYKSLNKFLLMGY